MKTTTKAVILAALFLFAAPALAMAQNWKTGPLTSDSDCDGALRPGQRCYYPFTDGTDSVIKEIRAEYATVSFDPDLATSGAATATVQIMQVKDDSDDGAAGSLNTSEPVNNDTLTGAPLDDYIYEVPRGKIWVNVIVASTGEDAVVTITGSAQ